MSGIVVLPVPVFLFFGFFFDRCTPDFNAACAQQGFNFLEKDRVRTGGKVIIQFYENFRSILDMDFQAGGTVAGIPLYDGLELF